MKVHSEGKLEGLSERALVEAALRTVGDSSTSRSSPLSLHPNRVPAILGYTIVREIHRGGQGVVYQAVRDSTGRTVAIKVMREGPFAGLGDRVRFDREVRILAQLEHPSIVAVHDSGEASGCFYFVMDYIHGEPLDAYVANEQPDVKKLIQLFAMIAEAVNAAHVRGIIHRDLKPSNVLVDAQHTPKILDFGLAKVAQAEPLSPAGSSITVTGQFVGSLPWASPEQAEGKHELVDVRTDVYALGVMLFQMLTGKFPYEVRGTIRDVLDNIVSAEPQSPSAIRRELDDEIGTIVLTALAKESDRRYQTAGELARDLRRYLADEPIAAKRDSSIYVLRKTLRRHRVAISVAGLFMAVLIGSGVISAVSYVKRREAQQDRLAKTVQFFERNFANINPDGAESADTKLHVFFADATRSIDELANEPEAQSDVLHMLGTAYKRISRYDEALTLLERALVLRRKIYVGPHAKVADTLHELAAVHWFNAQYQVAEGLYNEALAMRRELFGDEHVDVADTLNHLGACHDSLGHTAAAERFYRQALEMRRKLLGPQHADIAATLNNFATLKRRLGQYEAAVSDFREALQMLRRIQRNHPRLPLILTNLAGCLMDMNRHAEAAPLLAEALQIKRDAESPDPASIASTLHSLAELSFATGEYEQAMAYVNEALALRRTNLRSDHPSIGASAHLAGKIKMAQGDAAGAEPLLAEALRIRQAELTAGDQHTLDTLEEYAACLAALGKDAEAAKHFEEAIALLRSTDRGDSPQAHRLLARLADLAG